MSPNQWTRLREIAYQIEIARVGIAHALTVGRLSRDVGIYENQKTHLREKVWQIEKTTLELLANIQADEQAAFLKLLSPGLMAKVKSTLGRPFNFREDMPSERMSNTRLMQRCYFQIQYGVLPEPEDEVALCSLLLNASVRREVNLTDAQRIALLDTAQSDFGESLKSKLQEIVTNSQRIRLRETIFQIEIARMGLADAILNGKLGIVLKMAEDEKQLVARKASEIEAKAGASSVVIARRAQEQIQAELSPEQRSKMKQLLGEPFNFRDEDYRFFLN